MKPLVIGVAGGTGSGKSTIVRLLARFYDFAPGQMFLDGVDLMDIPSAQVRRRIGIPALRNCSMKSCLCSARCSGKIIPTSC